MKKLLAILLTLAMFATMIPVLTVGVSAEAPTYNDTWADHYDLSWITPSQTSSANTVTVGDKYYQVKGYAAETVFEIKDAADLAGLAYLSNMSKTSDNATHESSNNFGTDAWFYGCVFYLTGENYDLSGHYWNPIGNCFNYRFGGQLIGSKGKTDGTGGKITISNMVVNRLDTNANTPSGLVGAMCGGAIKNMDMVGAYITAACSRIGSFAGQFNAGVAENLSSNAVLKLTDPSKGGNAWDVAGGIIGCAYGYKDMSITNCHFTGTIDNTVAGGDVAGGILGVSQIDMKIENCTVTSDFIKVGVGNDGSQYACGGIVGILRNGNDANASESRFSVTGCTVTADLTDGKGRTGGIVGSIWADKEVVNIADCSYTGTLTATKTPVAPIVGHTDTKLSLSDCENNGTVENADSVTQLKFGQGTYTDGVVTSLNAQKSTLEGVKAVRVVAQVKAEALTGAGFDFVVSYKDAETEETVTTKVNSVELTKAFEAIYVDGTETAAAEGYVWVAFVLNNITADSVTISAVANATYTDSTVYGTVGSATIALA